MVLSHKTCIQVAYRVTTLLCRLSTVVLSAVLVFGAGKVVAENYEDYENYVRDGWPGEGRPVFAAKKDALLLYSDPVNTANSSTIKYRVGWGIPFTESKVITRRSVFLKIQKSADLKVWCHDDDTIDGRMMKFEKGQTIEYLQSFGEGVADVRVQEMVCTVDRTNYDVFGFPEPETQWWIKVAYADGSSPGWLLVDDVQVERIGKWQ